jgi:hypothetical protein
VEQSVRGGAAVKRNVTLSDNEKLGESALQHHLRLFQESRDAPVFKVLDDEITDKWNHDHKICSRKQGPAEVHAHREDFAQRRRPPLRR